MITAEINVIVPVNILDVKNGSFETPALSIALARLGPNTAIPTNNSVVVTPDEYCSVFNMDAVIGEPIHYCSKKRRKEKVLNK